MDIERFLDHPLLEKCRRKYRAGDFLFHQGETGQTMFLISRGQVRLIGQIGNKPAYTAALVGPGDYLGERVILNQQAHPRFFSGIAESDVLAVEIGPGEIARMEQEAPYLVKTLMRRSLELAEKRLEQANGMIAVLRSSDNEARFLNCLHLIAKTLGTATQEGIAVPSLSSTIHMHIDLSLGEIVLRLGALKEKKLIVDKGEDSYVIPDLKGIPAV
jgi:CRP/FNR family transcriptional regulator